MAFIAIKFSVIFSAGEFALGLSRADAARVGLLLAGGGEFAFVIFKLAEGERLGCRCLLFETLWGYV